jgi:CheY-like chemotaxis protein
MMQPADVTAILSAREAASQRLEAACARARDADQRKDDFLAMLGHELRNPLSPIALALELMRDACGSRAERERAIIERQVAHMTRLVDDLLDTSRIARGKLGLERRIVELAPIVREADDMTRSAFTERAQTLAIDVPEHGVRVFGDPTRPVAIVTSERVRPRPTTATWLRAEAANGTARIVVEDDGMGQRKRCDDLDPRSGSRETTPGAFGPGLARGAWSSCTRSHRGRERRAGSYSRFTVSLADERDRQARRTRRRHRSRVLVVDDNDDAVTMLRSAQRRGSRFASARWTEALMSLRSIPRCGARHRPARDGRLRAAERMREEHHDHPLKLIALTGYGQPSDHERSAKAGFSAHLVKPVDLAQLERCLS